MNKNRPPTSVPLWLQDWLSKVDKRNSNDDYAVLINLFQCDGELRKLIDNPSVLKKLLAIHKGLVERKIPNANDRTKRFLVTAATGYLRACKKPLVTPSLQCRQLLRLENAVRKFSVKVESSKNSPFLRAANSLAFLLERMENPRTVSIKSLKGFRADHFLLSPLPKLDAILLSFADTLREHWLEIQNKPSKQRQTFLNRYLDKLIRKSHELFDEIPSTFLAEVATVITSETVLEATVRKRPITVKLAPPP